METGLPLPISFKMVHEFHRLYTPEVSLLVLKEIVGALDLYYLERVYNQFKFKQKTGK